MEPSRDLGLQHALRNGIALLDGRETGQDRSRVLGGLLEIVGDADRGSGALQEQSLTFALNERSAFERYSLFVRYLSGSIADLPQRLAEARRVLQRVGEREAVDRAEIAPVEELLGRLLSALERDRNLAPLSTVRDVHFN
jgi:hypothetical protein